MNGTGAAEKHAHLHPPFPGGYYLENYTLPSGRTGAFPHWDVDFIHRYIHTPPRAQLGRLRPLSQEPQFPLRL